MTDITTRLRADGDDEAADEIERLREFEFNRGYIIACSNLLNMHDCIVEAVDIFNELGITRSDIPPFDLSEYDAAAIKKILADPRCNIVPRRPGPKGDGG